jgi:hypothetical protein
MAKRRSRAILTSGPMALAMDDMTTWRPEYEFHKVNRKTKVTYVSNFD